MNWSRKEGWRRLLLFIGAIWMVGWYVPHRPEINVWIAWAGATPQTTCADVFAKNDPRLSACGAANYGGLPPVEEYLSGRVGRTPGSFNNYMRSQSATVFWVWLIVPAALLVMFYFVPWIIRGFALERNEA